MISLLVLQPTPFCNINCDYCYLPNRNSAARLSLDTLESVVQRVFESGLVGTHLSVVWHAGEPLVAPASFYRSAFHIIGRLNQTGCHISHCVQTNGTLLTEDWCSFIKEHGIQIGVSLDGPAFIHDAHRKTRGGQGTHVRVMRGVSLLQDNDIAFHVIAVVSRISLDYPDEIFAFFVEHGIRHVGFNMEETEGIHTSSSLNREATESPYRAFMARLYYLAKASRGAVIIREFEWARNAICRDPAPCTSAADTLNLNHQVVPFGILTVDSEGNFSTFSPELLGQTSTTYGGFSFGNARCDRLVSAYTLPRFQHVYRDIAAGVELCRRTCQYFDLCGGGAPVNKSAEHGSFSASETMYCRYAIQIPIDIVLEDLESVLPLTSASGLATAARARTPR